MPHTRWALTKRNTRTAGAARAARRSAPELMDDDRRCRTSPSAPCAGSAGASRARSRGWRRSCRRRRARVDYIDRSDKVFTSPRLVRFYEMEYADPGRGRARGAQPGPRARRPHRRADQLPGRGAGHRRPTTSRCRRRPAGAPATSPCTSTRDTRLRPVLHRGRGDHGRLRRPAPLGQAALPDGGDAGAPLPAVGRVPGRCAAASTPTAASPTPTSTGCSAPTAVGCWSPDG